MAVVASAAVAERKEGGVYWWSVSRSMGEVAFEIGHEDGGERLAHMNRGSCREGRGRGARLARRVNP